ncbi:hypothetical protein [Helicobacter cynogastricus]|uniref:hypothetical protein n=1 Tax=Helicobacter cynogastricus TaxID=329937 RepID=UPI000CF131CB|nr:hypothetical protein [Helicobacter cynogastricus]
MKKRYFRFVVFLAIVGVVFLVMVDIGRKVYLNHLKSAPPRTQDLDQLGLGLMQPISPGPSHTQSNKSKEAPDFDYPTLERRFTLEFRSYPPVQRLRVQNLDSYQLFCLNEILKTRRIDFATDKKGHSITLIIYLPRSPVRQAFLDDLRYYQIPYHFD